MLRLVLLLLYLAGSFSTSSQMKIGGGWDPNGLTAPARPSTPTVDSGGGLDPNGGR